MSVRSGQSITVEFVTSSFSTGAATNADSLPSGILVVNGVDNAASVTVANIDAGRYSAAVTLPTLAIGDVVELSIAATVGGVAGKGIVWVDSKDVLLDSAGDVTFNNSTLATVTNLTNAPTAGDFTAAMKTSLNAATPASVQNVAAQTGDAYARLGAPANASVSADVAAVKSDTGTILTDVNTGAGAIYNRLGAPAGASIAADIATRSAPGTAQTIDQSKAVATTGNAANTIGDCLNAARAQGFGAWKISGTTLTLYASDGVTAVRTFTLDSATAPTSRT